MSLVTLTREISILVGQAEPQTVPERMRISIATHLKWVGLLKERVFFFLRQKIG